MSIIKYNAAFDLLHNNALNLPKKLAFIDDNESINYFDLQEKVKSLSKSLLKLGLNQGDKVIICMHDCINFPISFLGAIWSGIIPVSINTMLPKQDLKYMLEDSGAKAIICSENLLNNFVEINKELNIDTLLLVNVRKKSIDNLNCSDINNLFNEDTKGHLPAITLPRTECFWLYSSGSTGKPKGTIHLHESLINSAKLYAKNILAIKENDIFFSAAKLFFAYGLGNALTFPLSIGGTSILTEARPTVDLVCNIIKKNSVSLFFGVPTLYAAMLNSKLIVEDFQSLRLSVSAGEALPEHLCNKWYETIGCNVLDGIGSTEMLHIFISNSVKEIYPGASGKPVPGYEARLIKDNKKEASVNEIGELEIKGPTSAIAYWNKPEKSKSTFLGQWTRTGDKYTKNKLGVYTYCGRADDMMKVSGQYVSPFEVEAVLQSHNSVIEVAVVGARDKEDLLKPKAYIVLKEGILVCKELEQELTELVKATLTPFKYPRWYEFVISLPKTATGKIQRYKLRNK